MSKVSSNIISLISAIIKELANLPINFDKIKDYIQNLPDEDINKLYEIGTMKIPIISAILYHTDLLQIDIIYDIIANLIDRSADVNMVDENGLSPLMYFLNQTGDLKSYNTWSSEQENAMTLEDVEMHEKKIIKLLLDNGADLNHVTLGNKTIIEKYFEFGCYHIILHFLELSDINFNTLFSNNKTLLENINDLLRSPDSYYMHRFTMYYIYEIIKLIK